MTFPDKTMYPVASTNVADLENLMGVYLDAVLHPAIYDRPRIFEQEGWHLEADDSGRAPLQRRGLQRDEGRPLRPRRRPLPGARPPALPRHRLRTRVRRQPTRHPALTYEAFLDSHARHYALPNSYTILYGDLDIDRELAFYRRAVPLRGRRRARPPNPLEPQAPARARREVPMATDRQQLASGSPTCWERRRTARASSPSTSFSTPCADQTRPRSSAA